MWRREDVIKQLREHQGEQSLRSFARAVGCSAAYLSDIYNGNREPGKKILTHLGLERKTVKVVTYTKRRWQ